MKHLFTILAALALLSACCQTQQTKIPENKKAIMDAFVAGTLDPSYVPAAFFAHFPGPKVGEGAVRSHLDFYLKGNADILKVQFEQFVPRIAEPEKEETWAAIGSPAESLSTVTGNAETTEPGGTVTAEPGSACSSLIPEDFYRPTLELVSGIQAIAGQDVYVLPTIYSPYQVALHALGESGIREAANNHPDGFKRLLDCYAASLQWLVRECVAVGIEGFYMTCQGGEMKYYDIPDFYGRFVRPSDLSVMNCCAELAHMNILHICDWEGVYDDLTRYADYPGQIVNTPIDLNGTRFTLEDGVALFGGRPVLGGLERKGIILSGSAADVAAAASRAIADGPRGKMMLGAECTVSDAPMANIHAAILTAHRGGDVRE